MIDEPMKWHDSNEMLYTRDGYHFFYKGEENLFDMKEGRRCDYCQEITLLAWDSASRG